MRALYFAATFVVLFFLHYTFLAAVDALPEPVRGVTVSGGAYSGEVSVENPEAPLRIVASTVDIDAPVENPDSTDIATLDEALLLGAVRYPNSAVLGQEGTVLIFGHSSYLPVVYNRAYKAFNGIQNLKTGDIITVSSVSTQYRYRVTGVRQADASEDVVELPAAGRHLALVTCDSFGRKTDRFIVTADFVETAPL